MRRWRIEQLVCLAVASALLLWGVNQSIAQQRESESSNMRLVGQNGLQGRTAYQPIIHPQGNRWIAYIGHHGGQVLNPLTGKVEDNGTSIVDVTDPRNPRYLYHISGQSSAGEAGGAQMVRACDGKDLPRGDRGKTYLLRTFGSQAHEVWDVTNPSSPRLVTTVVSGLKGTHKNWWECDTGIAYLVSDAKAFGWKSNRITKVYDLSDPANPRFIRDFGLVGQEPGSPGPAPQGLHGLIRLGDRIYIAYGTSSQGIVQIVDREKLLKGNPNSPNPFAPTPENLLHPQVGRLDMPSTLGGHTTFPVLGVPIQEFSKDLQGKSRDFLIVVSEATQNQCQQSRHLAFFVDMTEESKPFPVSNFQVPEALGNFCDRGGRFGTHATNESFTPIYYKKMIFISYFNAGVRAVDIRDPYHPKEVGFFIPATTEKTDKRCVKINNVETCKVAIQTNNVEVDDRGYIYIVDRANTGMHILELTGSARQIANLP